jgi:hypothetical protein
MQFEESSGQDDLRRDRLASLFHRICHGKQTLAGSQGPKNFLEAVCAQPDPVHCTQKLISSPNGLSALQSALRSNDSLLFLTTSATPLLKYIQFSELADICQGDFLRNILRAIADPPFLWNALLKEFESDRLNEETTQSFSWLLLQLISFPGLTTETSEYYKVAKDPSIQKALLKSPRTDIRIIGQKIKHTVDTITNPTQFQGEGPSGRHDNDFVDIHDIAILPTPDEIESTDPPYLRRAIEIDDCPESQRLSMQIDNQFRLLREDMLRDLREELQVALGAKKGHRKGVMMHGLKVIGLDLFERRPWGLRLQSIRDLPEFYKCKTRDARKKYVDEHRYFLKHQSVACLVINGKPIALGNIHRDEDLLAQSLPVVCVQLSGSRNSIIRTLLSLRPVVFQLVQLNTAVYSYEPVLRQLQDIKQLHLMDETVLWSKEQKLRTAPILDKKKVNDLVNRIQHDPSQELQSLLNLPKSTRLDSSQAKCLSEGLTRSLSLVQGPPGKSNDFLVLLRC